MIDGRSRAGLLLLSACFLAAGLLFIPRLGIEVDEALLGSAIFPNSAPWFSVKIGGRDVPLMLMSHLGALKAWLYTAIFALTPPRPMSLRFPTLLLAAGSLWIFFALLDRTLSRRAAWIGTTLLATDTSYVLMNAIDYGPVTIQLTLKLAALVLFVRSHQAKSRAALAGAFFCLGLALWDKAIFSWVLSGFAVAGLIVFPREIFGKLTWPNLRVSIPAFLLGAFPLIYANTVRPLQTFRSNAHLEPLLVWAKSITLRRTLEGHVFNDFFFAETPGPDPGQAGHWHQSVSFALSDALNTPQRNLTFYATVLAVAAIPFLWRTPARRPMLFALISSFVAWVMMAYTAGAGAAAQHVMLLWPAQFVLIAAALDRVRTPTIPIAATALLCTASLAVTNQYYATVIRNGPGIRWTDAMDPLHRSLADSHAPRIYVADWGLVETMQLMSEGQLPISMADLSSPASIEAMLNTPGALFVSHARGIEIDPHQRASLDAFAQQQQYVEEPVATIHDRNGRPAFDVFRFRKLHL